MGVRMRRVLEHVVFAIRFALFNLCNLRADTDERVYKTVEFLFDAAYLAYTVVKPVTAPDPMDGA